MLRTALLFAVTGIAVHGQIWEWKATAPLGVARSEACAVRLADGRVMVSGGQSDARLNAVEIYRVDPEESFSAAAPLLTARSGHGCTLLDDGRPIVAGGGADTLEIWEPSLDRWTEIKSSVLRGPGTSALRLNDGRILISGGGSAILELFEGSQLTPIPSSVRSNHTATLLSDGRVLLTGGTGEQSALNTAEIFDPDTNETRSVPAMSVSRTSHTATLLLDGRVLIAGGSNGDAELNSLEVYLPETNRFDVLGASLKNARQGHVGLLVDTNGTVLIAGGSAAGDALNTTERFDPTTDQVAAAGSLTAARTNIAGVMLEDGRVLATGGRNANGASAACGVITSPVIKFSQGTYHPGERAVISSADIGVRVSGTATLTLQKISLVNGAKTQVNSRLLAASLTLTNGQIASTAIMNVFREDIGNDFLLTVSAPSNISIQAKFSAKLRSTLLLSASPAVIVQQQSLKVNAQLLGDGSPVAFSGLITVRTGLTSATATAAGNASVFTAQVSTCCEAPGSVAISGTYPGNAFLDAASANIVNAIVVSRTPAVSLGIPSFRLATAATFRPRVTPQGAVLDGSVTVDNSIAPTGSVTLRTTGVSGTVLGTGILGPPTSLTLTLGPTFPFSEAAINYTPTTADRRSSLCLDASYSGDTRYLATSLSAPSGDGSVRLLNCSTVGPAATNLQVLTPPAQYAIGGSTPFSVRLTWPDSVGIVSRTVNLTTANRTIGQITLVPNRLGLGVADGTGNFVLPFNTQNISYTYAASGDLDGSSTSSTIAMARVATTMATSVPATVTNPFSIPFTLTLSTNGVPLPPGTVLGGTIEFRDGDTLLGTATPTLATSGSGISDGSSNTISFSENPRVFGSLPNNIRPLGRRTITVRYLGSPLFVDSQATATVTVQ